MPAPQERSTTSGSGGRSGGRTGCAPTFPEEIEAAIGDLAALYIDRSGVRHSWYVDPAGEVLHVIETGRRQ